MQYNKILVNKLEMLDISQYLIISGLVVIYRMYCCCDCQVPFGIYTKY